MIEEEEYKTFAVKINPELLKKIRMLSSHYEINQDILLKKLVDKEWEEIKHEIVKIQ